MEFFQPAGNVNNLGVVVGQGKGTGTSGGLLEEDLLHDINTTTNTMQADWRIPVNNDQVVKYFNVLFTTDKSKMISASFNRLN